MNQELVSILLGILAAVLANVGLAVQKQGAWALPRFRTTFRSSGVRWGVWTWVVGTGLRIAGLVLVVPALQIGQASIVATFGGLGLASLVLYTTFVMREPLDRREGLGIALITMGTMIAGYYGCQAAPSHHPQHLNGLAIFTGLTCGVCLLVCVHILQSWQPLAALVLGICGGVADGIGLVVLKVVGARVVGTGNVAVLGGITRDLWTWGFLAVSLVGFILVNWAYMYGKAVTIVPAYTCAGILLPVGMSPFVFGEHVSGVLLLGVLVLVLGVVILGRQAPAELNEGLGAPA